jgi:hypothetical protein
MSMVEWGILCTGLVFGFLLFYAVRRTPKFNVESLSTVAGALGGATVIGWLGKSEGWVGPYGIGLALGFFVYFAWATLLIVCCPKLFEALTGYGVMLRTTSNPPLEK